MNGDGKPDLVTSNSGTNRVAVLLGRGAGLFMARAEFATGSLPQSLAIRDLNGDGTPDLVTANQGSNTVSVLLGNGAGGFGPRTDVATGDGPASVAVGDVNGDGKPDIVTANSIANTVSVLPGDGSGGFGARTDFETGAGPSAVAIGDVNGDGNPDLAVANRTDGTVSVLLGDGTGAFEAGSSFRTGTYPGCVAICDVSADGLPDLLVANVASNTVSVLLGSGAGGFGAKTDYATGSKPYSFAVGDLDGDGIPDLAVANQASITISALLGLGAGRFAAQTTFPAGTCPQSVAIGDLNGDGRLDLVETNNSSSSLSVLLNTSVGALFSLQPAGTPITQAYPCVAVPVRIDPNHGAPLRGFSATLHLSTELVTCGAGITEGPFLSAVGSTFFQVIDHGGGSYTVDCAILGLPCGTTEHTGTAFTLHLGSSVPGGTGTVTMDSVTARGCDNNTLARFAGMPVRIPIDRVAPEAMTDLAAVQQKSGNYPGTETTNLTLTFTAPGDAAGIEVYRAPFGGTDVLPLGTYPEYGGGVPAAPGYPPAEPWEPTSVGASDDQDNPGARGFWYYVAFSKDAFGNVSPVSNVTTGNLDYFLGDVANGVTDCAGDDVVDMADISMLGAHYGATLDEGDALACLDVGRTTNGSVDARPVPDNRLNFEDLMLYAIHYGNVSAPQFAAQPSPRAANALSLAGPDRVAAGETFTVDAMMQGAGNIQGLSSRLDWDREVAEPVSVIAGEWFAAQGGVVFSSRPGQVDCALLGPGRGIAGGGVLATVTFRALAAGAPKVALESVDARDTRNQAAPLAGGQPAVPGTTSFAPPMPNPFGSSTTLSFALARSGAVTLAVYGVDGRRVATLANDVREAGTYRLTWNGRDGAGHALRSGIYYVRLSTPEGGCTRTLVLTK